MGIKPREGETTEEALSRVSLETGMKLWNINSGKKTDISCGGLNYEIMEVVDGCLEYNLMRDDLNASQKKRDDVKLPAHAIFDAGGSISGGEAHGKRYLYR
ncbi:MAG: hypothetical protein LBO05_05570 [Deltaproteobacteria bacterium]|nr:hypothetical protein [Deltaproteobacteria bacterium]